VLWYDGDRREAIAEAGKAKRSDEAYVRSTAVLLLAAGDLAAGRRGDAIAQMRALAGHDYRFAEPVAHLAASLVAGGDPGDAIGELRGAVASQDRSADAVTAPLLEALSESARSRAEPSPGPVEAAR
jgi:hypothetical protein